MFHQTMKSFGHSIKNGHLVANTEITLLEHNCSTPPCTITQVPPPPHARAPCGIRLLITFTIRHFVVVAIVELPRLDNAVDNAMFLVRVASNCDPPT